MHVMHLRLYGCIPPIKIYIRYYQYDRYLWKRTAANALKPMRFFVLRTKDLGPK